MSHTPDTVTRVLYVRVMKPSTLRCLAGGAVALTVGAIVAVPGSAHAATVTSPSMLSISNGVYFDDCMEAPYDLDALNSWSQQEALNWGNINGFYNYDLKLKVINPDGTVDDDKEIERMDDLLSNASGYDNGYLFLCNQAGTYKIQASGWWCPIDETPEDSPADCESIAFAKTFTMRSARSSVTLSAPKKAKAKKPVTIVASVKVERSTGMYADDYVSVALQQKKGTKWVRVGTYGLSDGSGRVKFKTKPSKPGSLQVRAVVLPDSTDFYASSTSAVATVKVKR